MSLEDKSLEELEQMELELQLKDVIKWLADHDRLGVRNTADMAKQIAAKEAEKDEIIHKLATLDDAIDSKKSSWWPSFSWGGKGGRRTRRTRGGGWSMGSMITPGSYEYAKYTGAGTDCAGTPVRAGFLANVSGAGLPYRASGGKRSGKRSRRSHRSALRSARHHSARHHSARRLRSRKSRGGAASAMEYDNNLMRSTPGTPPGAHTANQVQRGGRYEMTMGPLVAGSAIGMSGMGMAARIPCEQSTMNPLNQHGGAFPAVQVGAADMMRYEAQNAGYANQMVPFPSGGAIPGMMTQVPYAAGSMNRACLTTGGKRSKRNKRSKRHHRK